MIYTLHRQQIFTEYVSCVDVLTNSVEFVEVRIDGIYRWVLRDILKVTCKSWNIEI